MPIPATLATHLGRPLSPAEIDQAMLWTDWILADIARAADRVGLPVEQIDDTAIERFAVAAISRRWDNPQQLLRIDVAIDDGRVSRAPVDPRMTYLPEWWGWLGLPDPDGDTDTGWSGSIGYGGRP